MLFYNLNYDARASSGIGKAVSEQLAENGVNLIITARRKDRNESLAKDLKKRYGVNVLPLTLDVSKESEIKSLTQHFIGDFKNIDILSNNVGARGTTDLIQHVDIDDWVKIIDTNLKGLILSAG